MNKGVIAVIVVVVLLVVGLIVWKGGGGGTAPATVPTAEEITRNIPMDRIPPERQEAVRNAAQGAARPRPQQQQ